MWMFSLLINILLKFVLHNDNERKRSYFGSNGLGIWNKNIVSKK